MASFNFETGTESYSYGFDNVEVINETFRKVYQYMALGLIITAVTAYLTASSPALLRLVYSSPVAILIIALVEIILVIALRAAITKLSQIAALLIFAGYSVLNGLLCSSILLVYTASSIYQAFFTTAAMFGAMSIYGLYTQRDLTSLGSFLHMGLWGLLIALVVNLFIGSSMIELVTSVMGVIIFVGLTAYDTAKIKTLAASLSFDDGNIAGKIEIIGALELYLDFVNLFLYLLRFMGKRKD